MTTPITRTSTAARVLLAACLVAAAAAGCGPDDSDDGAKLVDRGYGFGPTITDRIRPAFDPAADSFFRTPWPSDARRDDDGTLIADDFPHGDQFPISNYLGLLEEIDGFSTLPVVYVPLDRSVSEASIPAPADTLEAESSVQLIDVSEAHCGRRIPVDISFDRQGGRFARQNTLRAATAYGFPLQRHRTYALVVRRNFGNPDDAGTLANQAAQDALAGDLPTDASEALRDWQSSLAPLRECAARRDQIELDDIGIATVFTTQDPVEPLLKLRAAAADPAVSGAPSVSNWRLWDKHDNLGFRDVYRASFEAPIFQRGDPPFATGGGFGMLDGGDPEVRSRQTVPFNLMVPARGSPPYPLVIWQPGTGGDAESVINQQHLNELVTRGFAVATFTPPFHGSRPGSDSPITNTFDYINARAGRSNIRQQAAETTYFIRVLRQAVDQVEDRPNLDFEPLVYGGQSQGSVVGTLLAGVEPDIDIFAFNGVGGYFATSVLYRNDEFINVQETIRETLNIERPIDRYSLIVQMAQTIVDVGDPMNFARRWRGWEEAPDGAHMLIINGGQDQTFTRNAMNSLTIAAGVPPVGTPGWPYDPDKLVDIASESYPVRANRSARDGSALTFGTRMVAGSGHFTIFEDPDAASLLVDYIDSSRDDDAIPTIGANR